MSTNHPNSRKVTLFRANNFMQRAQNPENDEQIDNYMSVTSVQIGPYYESYTNRLIGSGLTPGEQSLLMPHILYLESDEKGFREKVFEYFNCLVTKIPYATGRELEIGLEKSNDQPVSKENLPIKIEDYVRYRHARRHPWVAADKSEAGGNQLKYFYMYDSEKAAQADNDRVVIQDKAESIWLKIKSQPSKVNMLLTMLGRDEREFLGRQSEIKKQTALRDIVSNKAVEFLKVYEEDRFELRYWLKAMVQAKVVKQVGTSYIITENSVKLGASEMEALLYLEDEKNVDTIGFLKGATQDVMRKPKATREKIK